MSAVEFAWPSKQTIEEDLHTFVELARKKCGSRFKGAYLFGSRARGDEKLDSDADLAILIEDVDDCWTEDRLLKSANS